MPQWKFFEVSVERYSPAIPDGIPGIHPQPAFYTLRASHWSADGNHATETLTPIYDLDKYLAQQGLDGWQLKGVDTNDNVTRYYFEQPL